jgi:hypothetical protein
VLRYSALQFCIWVSLASLQAISALAQSRGEFIGTLVLEDIDETAGRNFKLREPFAYRDPDGLVWEAKAGTVIDGASIPRPLWTIVGSPYTGLYRRASVIHDYYCMTRERQWEAVHKAFYDAMITAGVGPQQAKLMYYAVYRFGPRWTWQLRNRTQDFIDPETKQRRTRMFTQRFAVVSTAAIADRDAPAVEGELRSIQEQIANEDIGIDALVERAKAAKPVKRIQTIGSRTNEVEELPSGRK